MNQHLFEAQIIVNLFLPSLLINLMHPCKTKLCISKICMEPSHREPNNLTGPVGRNQTHSVWYQILQNTAQSCSNSELTTHQLVQELKNCFSVAEIKLKLP